MVSLGTTIIVGIISSLVSALLVALRCMGTHARRNW